MLAWKRSVPILSWITGWISVAAWIALVASAGLLGSQLIVGIISFMNPVNIIRIDMSEAMSYAKDLLDLYSCSLASIPHIYLLQCTGVPYQRLRNHPTPSRDEICFYLVNYRIYNHIDCAISLLFADVQLWRLCLPSFRERRDWLAGWNCMASGASARGHVLFQDTICTANRTLGFGLIGYDAVSHMIEEIPNPSKEGPKIMVYCVGVGLFTGFIFLTVLLFVAGPFDDVVKSSAGPVLQIFYDATNNKAGSICLLL